LFLPIVQQENESSCPIEFGLFHLLCCVAARGILLCMDKSQNLVGQDIDVTSTLSSHNIWGTEHNVLH